MIKAKLLGPIHHADLSPNTLARKFLLNFSSPIRYLFGLAVGLVLGAMHPEHIAQYAVFLSVICALALVWVLVSLMARSVVKKAFSDLMGGNDSLSNYQLMHSKSWIAAVKTNES